MKAILAALLFATTGAWASETLEQTYAAYGRVIVQPFAAAPFPHPQRAAGHRYRDRFFPASEHYSDSTVALFIPRGFRETTNIDLVVHFHGWDNSVAGTLETFKLIEQFAASGRNAVLIVPEGPRNASDSFGGKLEDADGFKRFVEEAMTVLHQQAGFQESNSATGRIVLSGHSGGYRVIAAILERGGLSSKVKEVWLFDALYAETDKFLTWWQRERGRLIVIYTEQGGTKSVTEAMMAALKQRGDSFWQGSERSVSEDELRGNRLIFLHTDLTHNEVLERRRTFGRFLTSSGLAGIRTEESKNGARETGVVE
ncbi:MAG: hypothetical protein KIS67_11750 [Verrucomicrobiae bacterium]|nr:hypothetical protein [Verrucomicrobiae bacterium]